MATAKEAMSKSLYGVHPGVAMVQKWIAEMKAENGAVAGGMDCAGEEGRTERG